MFIRLPTAGWLAAVLLASCGGGGSAPDEPPPVLELVAPAGGGELGGSLVSIMGPGVGRGTPEAIAVSFGGAPATAVTVVDEATLACLSPAGALGVVDVVVSTQHGEATLAAAFTYHPAPTAASVTPSRGPAGGNPVLSIQGTGFLANDAGPPIVTIGGLEVLAAVVLDDTTLECQAPTFLEYTLHDVVVTNRNGIAALLGGYGTVRAPTLAEVAANVGPAAGSSPTTVIGSHFDGGNLSVTFDGVPAIDVEIASPNVLYCKTPEHAAGAVEVVVSTYGGTAKLVDGYEYYSFAPDDPLFGNQWHLENTGQYTNATAGEDANVRGVWNWGYTGQGVHLAIVDDGLELAHEDLADNVMPDMSWDYGDDDANPTRNAHGTAVAGVSSSVGRNNLGGTGAAPRSTVGGFAVLTSGTTDADFADALAREAPDTHAYNNSWGSPAFYNGVLYGFGYAPLSFHLAVAAGLTEGRGGLGSIYLKAAGNSGSPSAAYDGTNGIRGMLVIGAVNSAGSASYYSQPGACLLVSAPSNHFGSHPGITTADRTGSAGYSTTNYTASFGGTSSATPLVCGVVALILEANPSLRWWEVPLVLAESARKNDVNHADWTTNGAGFDVNHQYGFGVVDAHAAVGLARAWTPRNDLVAWSAQSTVNVAVPVGDATGISRTISVPQDAGIGQVHTATVTVQINHPAATDLDIRLTSPDGTVSRLTDSIRTTNTAGNSAAGIPMITWRHLGEAAAGDWTLWIRDGQNVFGSTWTSWRLDLEGEGEAAVEPAVASAKPSVSAETRPPAPSDVEADEAVWFDGGAWRRARLEGALLAVWQADAASAAWLAQQPEVQPAVVSNGSFAIVGLAGGRSGPELLAAAPDDVRPHLGLAYRDGPGGSGRLRALGRRVFVQVDPHASGATLAALFARLGLERVREEPLAAHRFALRTTERNASALALARALLDEDGILHAEPDWWVERQPY